MKHFLFLLLFVVAAAHAEDGSALWLRYAPQPHEATVEVAEASPTVDIAANELRQHFRGGTVSLLKNPALQSGAFAIAATATGGATITAADDLGLLYGAYELLRQQQMGGIHDVQTAPKYALRLLNHWDNLDLSVERGYAGKSIWRWDEINGDQGTMSEWMQQHVRQYCRANASVGINGSVLNNVNASPNILTTRYLKKVKVLADAFRPYGLRVYLSINFASPMVLGDTPTADPLDPQVAAWWREKADEIYRLIPDFGGFLVKANSEGQPGPGDYHRTHAEGANMLAAALKPHHGIVMWRSFVYGANHKGEDRVMQAVSEFKPMDGKFADNVILQSKNGPLDFQPREPYAPIFDNIKKTPQMVELQITQEYLGQSLHLVYLAPMWKEFFGFVSPDRLKGIAGVANIGDSEGWCGHPFSQANWYAFGRLAWDPDMSAEAIAREWLTQTFTANPTFVDGMTEVMMTSREACVDYMMPLGLHHIFAFDHHYGPDPGGYKAEYPIEWCPVYYHKADEHGVGFDRTKKGTGAVRQYRKPYCQIYNSLATCPEEYLLWFHHLPWDYQMKNGQTLWQNLQAHYQRGVSEVERYCDIWQQMRPYIDAARWQHVADLLDIQLQNAREWRTVCLDYFGQTPPPALPL